MQITPEQDSYSMALKVCTDITLTKKITKPKISKVIKICTSSHMFQTRKPTKINSSRQRIPDIDNSGYLKQVH